MVFFFIPMLTSHTFTNPTTLRSQINNYMFLMYKSSVSNYKLFCKKIVTYYKSFYKINETLMFFFFYYRHEYLILSSFNSLIYISHTIDGGSFCKVTYNFSFSSKINYILNLCESQNNL